jgi:hypothetical protein
MRTVVALSLVAMLVACAKVEESSYQTFAEAKSSGAVESGWVPRWLPASSIQIQEAHRQESKQSVLALRFSPTEPWGIPSSCEQIKPAEVQTAPFRPSWWPDVPPSGSVTHSYAYFSCEAGKSFLAVSTSQGELYFWRPHGI